MKSRSHLLFAAFLSAATIAASIARAEESTTPSLDLAQAHANETQEKVKPDIFYLPTPQQLVDVMLLMAEVKKDDLVYDLGSGDGRLVITAAKAYGARGIGIEIDPALLAMARRKAVQAKVDDKVEFRQQDLFKSDFKDATVITLYLLDELNRRLRPQLLAQVRPGTRIVSHAFHMGEWHPDGERTLKIEGKSYDAYAWVVPANMSGRWKVTSSGKVRGMPDTIVIDQTFQLMSVRDADGETVIGEGRVSGTEFNLGLSEATGARPSSFTGTVDGNRFKARGPGGATWEAEREAGTEKPLDPPQ